MNGDTLTEFLKEIAPYRSVWQSARISGLARQVNGQWISLALRVLFSELAPEPLDFVKPSEHFAYFDGRYPASDFDTVAEELVHGRYLTLRAGYPARPGVSVRVYLDCKTAAALSVLGEETFRETRKPNVPTGTTWYYSGFHKRGSLPGSYGTDRAGWDMSANGERIIDIFSYADRQRLDSKLRVGDPAFDGLEGLTSYLLPGLQPQIDRGEAQSQIVAPLPFFLEQTEPATLTIRAPAAIPFGSLALRFFFRPDGLPISRSYGLRPADTAKSQRDTVEWIKDIPWPSGSTGAKACLFFLDREIEALEMNRYAAGATLRAEFDDYFDPERHRLLQNLGLEPRKRAPKDQAAQFETAVARLMNLLGVPLVWYGDWLAEKGRPDLGGMMDVAGKRVAVLGECTLSKPEQKYSELHRRADELASKLGHEAEVIAVVFASCPTTQSESQRAAEHDIALIGSADLQQLAALLERPTDAASVLQLLRNARDVGLGLPHWSVGIV